MTDRNPNRIEQLFSEALRTSPGTDREKYLADSCDGDSAARTRIEALLTAYDQSGDFLETPIADEWGFVLTDELSALPEHGPPPEDDWRAILDAPENPDELGSFQGYSIIELLGQGGAGIVFKARDRRLNRVIALKVLAPAWAAQPHARKRFLREARAAAAIRHEHVVSIHSIDETSTLPFLVMEYVSGESLHARIHREGPMSIPDVVRISKQLAAGLAAAHSQRLVHRDMKPANVLLAEESGDAQITDFGLARTVDDIGITQEGVVAGTPQYMSPEQALGQPVDFRSDLFSLGCVIYAMCAGRPPFQADTTLAVMRMICEESPKPIAETRPEMPLLLQQLIDDLLAKDATMRPQTAEEVAERLDRIASDLDNDDLIRHVDATKTKLFQRPVVVGMLAVIALVAAAILFRFRNDNEPQSPEDSPPTASTGFTKTVMRQGNRTKRSPALKPALFDASTKPLTEFRKMAVPGHRIDALAISADGTLVYGGCSNGVIYVWDARTGKEVHRYPGHRPATSTILLSSDGTRMLSFGGDRVMRVWNTVSRSEKLNIRMPISFRSAALSPDGSEVAVAFYGGKIGARIEKMNRTPAKKGEPSRPEPVYDKISIFSVVTGQRKRFLAVPQIDSFHNIDWSPDGSMIAAGLEDGRVLILDATSGSVIKSLKVSSAHGPTYGVRFSKDGKRLLAAGSGNCIRSWNLADYSPVLYRRFQHGVVRFDASADNRWVAFGGRPEIRLLSADDPAGNDILLKLEGHTAAIRSVAFFPNSQALASYGRDGTVRLWRLPEPERTLSAPVIQLPETDGFATDTNLDGVFDKIDSTGPNLTVTRPAGTDTYPREVALLEFDLKSVRADDLAKAVLETRVTLAQSSSRDPTFDLEIHAYSADGRLENEDGSRQGVLVARVSDYRRSVGPIRFELDMAVVRRFLQKDTHLGLRISNTRGNRLILASRRTYHKNAAPVLKLYYRKPR